MSPTNPWILVPMYMQELGNNNQKMEPNPAQTLATFLFPLFRVVCQTRPIPGNKHLWRESCEPITRARLSDRGAWGLFDPGSRWVYPVPDPEGQPGGAKPVRSSK